VTARRTIYRAGRGRPSIPPPLAAALGVVALLLALWLFLRGGSDAQAGAAPPRRVVIPAIGVSARVIPLGLNRDGTLDVPRNYSEAGWYTDGPEPGETGPAVIVGHVDSKAAPAVFYKLRELRRGDAIRIARTDGSSVHFTVTRIEQWPKASFPTSRVYGRTRGSVLRLVTCSGDFNAATGHYANNTIVFASQR
jgi:hypothetical protein